MINASCTLECAILEELQYEELHVWVSFLGETTIRDNEEVEKLIAFNVLAGILTYFARPTFSVDRVGNQ
jgi:hypothetical protein